MLQLKVGDRVGIIALSNGLNENQQAIINKLDKVLTQWGLSVVYARSLYRQETIYAASDKERGQMLMDFYQDKRMKAIFDISGGDLANGVLSYLDYDFIAKNPKSFFGYSDLTVILNALYTESNQSSYLYQIRNLVSAHGSIQQKRFRETWFQSNSGLLQFDYKWVQGHHMEGIVIGGNIRCLLKLAGTCYFPNCENKILFLESLSGDVAKMATYLHQYKHLGVFNKISGLILGTFTEMEETQQVPNLITLVQTIVDHDQLPVIKTNEIGHGSDSRALNIGEHLSLP